MLILPREQLEQRVTRNEDIQSFRCQRQTYRIVYHTVNSLDKLHVYAIFISVIMMRSENISLVYKRLNQHEDSHPSTWKLRLLYLPRDGNNRADKSSWVL